MGNTKSTDHGSNPSKAEESRPFNPRVLQAFKRLTGDTNDGLRFEALKERVGGTLATSLWKYLSDGSMGQDESMSFEQFSRHAQSLVGPATDIYIVQLMPLHHLLKVCFEAAGVDAVQGDEKFINLLVEQMESGGQEPLDIVNWKRAVCPNLCNAVQAKVMSGFYGIPNPQTDFSSDILSPIQMFFLQCCLPAKFFPTESRQFEEQEKDRSDLTRHWTPLYSSAEHGISVNRFEANVFDYHGATIAIFELTNGTVAAIAADQEWRHSGKRFGGPHTALYQFSPVCKTIEQPGAIYCNLKLRSAALGLSFDRHFSVDKEMNGVKAIEVWGCSGATTLQEQQKLKQWQSRQVEKNKKVPLPGNWDENPDKTLLEMAGFTFSSERQDDGPPRHD
ncbi:hypothetical protein L596_018516 [Steinernema carpocapsae]|uniref:TLDc domain-containing protein n=1 Tax=Steinernema carpocapsae TaxID=34508 RepID=A0A4U5N5A2_STECR|nr:hypothetical protein L596_018516 [Steinernema carpocapsae]